MRRLFAVCAALALLACNRSDLLDETTCAEDGRYVVVQNHAFCVFPEGGTFPCPDALPFVVRFAEAGFCAIEEDPPEPLLGAALDEALDIDAAPVEDAEDAGVDGAIIDDGGPSVADASLADL